MANRIINSEAIAEIAIALKELKEFVVFIGGSVVGLYADALVEEELRPTEDIDVTIKLMSYDKWARFQERLTELSIHPDPFGHAICSYKYKDIALDIMPSSVDVIGAANRWYEIGFKELRTVEVLGESIQILLSLIHI